MNHNRRLNKPRRAIFSIDELPILCDAAEAGLLLRLNPERIAKMASDGILKGAKQGQKWFFRRDDLQVYLDNLFNNPLPPQSAAPEPTEGIRRIG